jgi:hypothetical protein
MSRTVLGPEHVGIELGAGRRIGLDDHRALDRHGAVGVVAPLVAPHQVAGEVMAVVDAAIGHDARLHAQRCGSARRLAAGVFHRPGEFDRRLDRDAALDSAP